MNKTHFSLAAICPPMIYGPAMQKIDIKHLNTSMGDIYRFIDGSSKEPGESRPLIKRLTPSRLFSLNRFEQVPRSSRPA